MTYPYPHHTQPFWPEYTLNGFGATIPVKVMGQTINIDVPIEKVAGAAATAAIDAAWPSVQKKLYAELPIVVNRALDQAEPRVRKEADRAIASATSRAALIGTALAVVIIGSAWWTRRAVMKGK